ncbi:trigger factor [Synechococcales cyanobacterium C]|uniref:Trigger factor n=1 Tax=Petrachloros mirabilis ULC683 TaxID=2781853 RepID=A0A8K1ZXT3_9CYAN|nr:trigger factor [Petrachloros mirabilis]NCJ05981.1 trigger factor [Petrachloros mirabilis ULC683]
MSETRTPIKVTQEKLAGSQVSLEIAISADRSRHAYEQVITKHMHSAQIPGFRKGKVPRQVVLQRFGVAYLKAVVLEDLVQKVLEEAIQQEEIPVLGNLQLRSVFEDLVGAFEPGAELTFVASADILPEVTLEKLQGFEVEAEEVLFDSQKVESVLREQQNARATLVPVEGRAASPEDVVIVDFAGRYTLAGEDESEPVEKEIEGGSSTDFQLELVENQFIPGFVEGVVGMAVGDTREIPVTFPTDYFQKELAGQAAVFTVTLNEIKAKELPALDDEFAQEISEFETLEALRQFLEERYQKEAQSQTDANIEAALIEALLQGLEVELPETLIRDEVNFLINQTAYQLQSQGIDAKKLMTAEIIDGMRDRTRPEAEARVRRTLALAEVAKQASLSIDKKALEAKVQELLQQKDGKNLDPERLRAALSEEMLQEQVLSWLKEHSQVTLVPPKADVTPATESEDAKRPELATQSAPSQPPQEAEKASES